MYFRISIAHRPFMLWQLESTYTLAPMHAPTHTHVLKLDVLFCFGVINFTWLGNPKLPKLRKKWYIHIHIYKGMKGCTHVHTRTHCLLKLDVLFSFWVIKQPDCMPTFNPRSNKLEKILYTGVWKKKERKSRRINKPLSAYCTYPVDM